MRKVVGICGAIGSGKGTVSDYLVEKHGYQTFGFADSIKDAMVDIFGWDRELLKGHTTESREWREKVDEWWAKRLNMPNLTPRKLLQMWGTDLFRNKFHEEIWIASVENKILSLSEDSNVVISDVRYPNEANSIRNLGAKIIKVYKDPTPNWHLDAIYDIRNKTNLMEKYHSEIHESEWAWLDLDFDEIIPNNGTKNDLYKLVDQWLEKSK